MLMAAEEFFGIHLATREIGPYRLSLREYAGNTRLPQHAHGDAFATVIVDGGFREISAGSSVDCGPLDVVVHAPGARHVDQFSGRKTRCLSVQGGSFERSALLATPGASSIALHILREFRNPDAFSSMVVEAMMLELFVAAERQREDARPPRWLVQVRNTIDRRFQESLTLTGLAQSADVHPAHLARAFRRHYRTTVGELLRELRVAYARQRLASPAPLQEIAHAAGFADQSHFTRAFRRATGLTPGQYRRALSAFQG